MSTARLSDGPARRAYALAGEAYLTLVGRESRFTYRVHAARGNATPGVWKCWFVSLMTGPDNGSDFQFIGTIFEPHVEGAGYVYRPGRRSTIAADAAGAKAFAWCWERLDRLDALGVEFWHSGKCGRCGKKLTTPDSVASGLGPVCSGRAA